VVGVVPLSTLSAELEMVSAPPGRMVRLEITCKGALIPALLRDSVFAYEIVGEPMVRFATVMVFVKLGLLSYETMSRTRSYAIVAIFVAAAVLTPTPDMLTMTLMAAPMIILYEICIWLAWFDRRKNRLREEQEARERVENSFPPADTQAAAAEPDPDPWSDANPQQDPHVHEAGDDGWTGEQPQQEFHAPLELPEVPPQTPPESPADAPAESPADAPAAAAPDLTDAATPRRDSDP